MGSAPHKEGNGGELGGGDGGGGGGDDVREGFNRRPVLRREITLLGRAQRRLRGMWSWLGWSDGVACGSSDQELMPAAAAEGAADPL